MNLSRLGKRLTVLNLLALILFLLGVFVESRAGNLASPIIRETALLALIPLFTLRSNSRDKKDRSKQCCPQAFSKLTEPEFDQLMELKMSIGYEKGDLIFQEGEFASGIYIICGGKVKVGKYYRNNKKLTLELLKAGEILGIEALSSEGPITRPGYAQAMEETELAFIEKGALLSFLGEHPRITGDLLRQALQKNVLLQRKMVQFALACADERVAEILLELGECYGTKKGSSICINFPLGRAELAELAGVSLETLIRSFSRLKHEGLIETPDHKRISLLDPPKLEEMTLIEPTPL